AASASSSCSSSQCSSAWSSGVTTRPSSATPARSSARSWRPAALTGSTSAGRCGAFPVRGHAWSPLIAAAAASLTTRASSRASMAGGRSSAGRPFRRPAVDRGPFPGKDRPVHPRARATILLVDDYPPNLTAMEAALEPLEQRLVKARSANEALKFLLSDESCALILLDVNMPGQDGFETAPLIRSRPRTSEIPILFVTAASPPEGAQLASRHRAADYIVRPIEPELLRTKVRAILELRGRAEDLERRLLRTAEHERAQL